MILCVCYLLVFYWTTLGNELCFPSFCELRCDIRNRILNLLQEPVLGLFFNRLIMNKYGERERERESSCTPHRRWIRPICQHIMGHNGKSSISATYVGEWDWQCKWHWHCEESRSRTLYPQSKKFFSFLTSLNSSKSSIGTRVQRSLHLLDENACDDGILGWERVW